MFTGIIQKKAKIKSIRKENEILVVSFELPKKFDIKNGASISINGVCSTITSFTKSEFKVGYMKETLNKTNVSGWKINDSVNLEPSLRLGDTLDGHFVYGHIDTVGTIKTITKQGDSQVFEISIPKEFLKYLVYKGSVAVNGVSLTVSARNPKTFNISLIPYTLEHTNLGDLSVGDSVNVEVDVMGKYILNSQIKTKK
ncbi:MAG: riboflavin synthase subunit alpha [Candidatus Taylorbacteria bacterium]|nr:riboflavin synthase subunit alpha [Candidatus Taylorbacteria bacterium]